MLFLLVLLGIVKGQVLVYFYPGANVTVPSKCHYNETGDYIECKCDCREDNCIWGWNPGDVMDYITFNRPRFDEKEIFKYGYMINNGINSFKINYQDCDQETCYYPLISYMFNSKLTQLILISCFTK